MDNLKRRIKRLGPLVRVRQIQLDQEAAALAKLRIIKQQAEQQLRDYQTRYMTGVNMLNEVRNSSDRQYLSILESGLDLLKSKWYRTLKILREIENREAAQVAQVKLARKNVKTMETLQTRYVEQAQEHESKLEMKQLDETAIRRFVTQVQTVKRVDKDEP